MISHAVTEFLNLISGCNKKRKYIITLLISNDTLFFALRLNNACFCQVTLNVTCFLSKHTVLAISSDAFQVVLI
jgi:hypothetical protein